MAADKVRFTTVRFRNYKALKSYSVTLKSMNVLVGPNNAGKSTVIGAFRILSEAIRRANAKSTELITIDGYQRWGYRVRLDDVPVSTENIFTNYDESESAQVVFLLSNGNELQLVFPEAGTCLLICITSGRLVRTPSDFRRAYPISIGVVPVLGPVEHNEPLYQKEAARNALISNRASRNFRNIWHHFPDNFEAFRTAIIESWPGMDIARPEIQRDEKKPLLHMYCKENRFDREIYWAGFGFQVWCQMLTYIIKSKNDSLLIIDEPDIYLHSDLQRQLIGQLRGLGPDILMATHATEIISEVESSDLLIVNKAYRSAKRITKPAELQSVFNILGSTLNPTLTQLAKTRRVLFVEGKDFQLLAALSKKLGFPSIATRSDFALVLLDGFNPQRVFELSKGMEITLGTTLLKGAILDRDYRSDDEVVSIQSNLAGFLAFAHIHRRKELENYLLEEIPLQLAVQERLRDRSVSAGSMTIPEFSVSELLDKATDPMKHDVAAQFVCYREAIEKAKQPSIDISTIRSKLMKAFDAQWGDLQERIRLVPGKEVFSRFNQLLQESHNVSISTSLVAGKFRAQDIPSEIVQLVKQLEIFRTANPPAQ